MKKETWQEVQSVLSGLSGVVRAAALDAQNWGNVTTEWLLTLVGLKAVTNDNNVEKHYQLVKQGVLELLYAGAGAWIIWQAYNLNETSGSITPAPITASPTIVTTTTEPNLPTFPTLPPNDENFYAVAEQFTAAIINNQLTTAMITIGLNKLFTAGNGFVKLVSGISNFDLYKTQKVIKAIAFLTPLTSFATAGFNFTDSNIKGGSLMVISAMMDIVNLYCSVPTKPNLKEEIIIKIVSEQKTETIKRFPLYKGILYDKDLKEISQSLQSNDWDKFEMKHSNKKVPSFVKVGKIKNWEATLTKFKEWIDNYTPENKKVAIATADDNGDQPLVLVLPDYEIEPEFIENANNDEMLEVVVSVGEQQPLISTN